MDIYKLSDDDGAGNMDIYKLSDDVVAGDMDVYKLSDDVVAGDMDVCKLSDGKDAGKLVVTDIRQAVKNENRVNVFVNSKYSFSLDISQVVDYKLKKGQVLSPERLEELKKASEFGKLYQRTLEWVLTRPRSVKETRDYLRKKIFEKKLDKEYIDTIIERLKAKNHLSDEAFSRYFIENRFVKKGVSKKRLKMELAKKGIDNDIIEQALNESDRNDEDEIKKIALKKRAKYDDEKLTAYLCRQGFSYDLVQEVVKSLDGND